MSHVRSSDVRNLIDHHIALAEIDLAKSCAREIERPRSIDGEVNHATRGWSVRKTKFVPELKLHHRG